MKSKQRDGPSLSQLRAAIPPRCFDSSLAKSTLYLSRDIVYAALLVRLALNIDSCSSLALRALAWTTYMFVQGCVGTGLWILGHECGHGSFSRYNYINDVLGWLIHSALLVPYFSWKITHARHHRYTGHITKDVVFVPKTEEDLKATDSSRLEKLLGMAEETSLVTMFRLLQHQLVGWQLYLFFNLTAGKDSLPARTKELPAKDLSHFNTSSRLFLPSQRLYVLLSDLGIIATLGCIWLSAQYLGYQKVSLLYIGPYLWTHHWLVAITYLHHTHPDVPYYKDNAWTFTQGALGTVDRSFGFIGQHFFHNIIDFHLVHHLFPRIPFYHAEEATKAIIPLLGTRYVDGKQQAFFKSLYTTFKSCNVVVEAQSEASSEGSGTLFWHDRRT